MSTTSIPYLAAEGATSVAISLQPQANRTAAAKVAASIAAYFTAVGSGNFANISAQVSTAIGLIQDPALQQFAANLWTLGQPALSLEYEIGQNMPLLGESLQGWFADTGAGIAAAAGAELSTPAAK